MIQVTRSRQGVRTKKFTTSVLTSKERLNAIMSDALSGSLDFAQQFNHGSRSSPRFARDDRTKAVDPKGPLLTL
jgi:hypothetical protein